MKTDLKTDDVQPKTSQITFHTKYLFYPMIGLINVIYQSEGCERGYLIPVRVGMGPRPWGRVGGGVGVGGGAGDVGGHG